MIFLGVREDDEREPMGFNCGASDSTRARWVAQQLRDSLSGNMHVSGPEMTGGGDFIVTVMCRRGTLRAVIPLVEASVTIWRARGQLD